ncbi:MAG: hypothetical protein KJN63_08380, partial [Acidimicrobiia bacterium]|nr:hypothetical protein [Acidimicrobiia bacterium]
ARTALAGMYFRQGRAAEAKSVYEHAVAEMTISGDRITEPIGALFAGVCHFGSLDAAELRCRSLGIDPTGWVRAFKSIVGFEESLRTGG